LPVVQILKDRRFFFGAHTTDNTLFSS
jgi:hypothetical protein